ncbi:hypothetical protein [Clostridium perfringens]|uniref:pyocin knob domain-containing protein n=1 Tax=Clostridium perfringens TaxID=1502 RepID=UPI0030CCF374
MGTYKTDWQLTETVMPEDMNRIEENTKENNNALSEFKKQYNADSKEENKKIDRKAEKEDVILKVPYPEDRDCNSFKTLNAFCVFDTGIGDFKNTPEGNLAKGSARVFILTNRGFNTGRLQQEFACIYPQDRVTRYIRNWNNDSNGNWGTWWKVYDEANKPTPHDIGAVNKNGDTVSGTIKFESNGNEIEIVNPSQGLQARGMVFKDNYTNNNIIGMFGAYMNSHEMIRAFMGITATPWDGRKSLTVDKEGCYYDNQKIYHVGNKPTPEEINAWDKTAHRLEGVDLNTITAGGIYATVRNTFEKHAPIQADGRLIVLSWNSGNWASQMFFADGGRIFTRTATNIQGTTWTNWTELYTRQSKPTPNDIGAVATRGDGVIDGKLTVNQLINVNPFAALATSQDGTQAIECGTGPTDVYIHNKKANTYLQMKDDGSIQYNNQKIYHVGNKPTLKELGADDKYFARRGEIGNTVDWNSILEPGCYKVQMAGWGNENTHAPRQGYSYGLLLVYRTGIESEDRIYQEYLPHRIDEARWFRMCNSQGWQEWQAIDVRQSADSRYLGKNSKAVDSDKLKGWLLAESSTNYRGISFVANDGVMELGHILDFHIPGSKNDYDVRAEAINGCLKFWQDTSSLNVWARKYLRINDWYGGNQDGRLWYKQENKGLYTENVEDFYVQSNAVARGKNETIGNATIYHLGGGLRLVRQVYKTAYANSSGGVSYTIHFPKAWSWVQPISLVAHNYGDATNNTSGYCTIDTWSNTYLNGGCYQMVAGKPTQIILTYIAAE